MIFNAVGPEVAYYRVLTPSWAFQPRSGAGAAAKGGRFNRPGIHAVYLSAAPDTAVAEYGQAERLFSPGTLAAYRVTLGRIVDFSGGYSPAWDALWRDWDCAWKDLWFRHGSSRRPGKCPISCWRRAPWALRSRRRASRAA